MKSKGPYWWRTKSLTIQRGGQQAGRHVALEIEATTRIWHGAVPRGPFCERTSSEPTEHQDQAATSRADRAAAAAFLHDPRHHHCGRLRMAEGRQLAGGAARSLGARSGYPKLS